VSKDHEWVYNLNSKAGGDLMKPLVAVFKQMDDIGTINVEITTLEDYTAKEPILYRVPREAVFNSVDLFPTDKL
jgi:hypothetical protein